MYKEIHIWFGKTEGNDKPAILECDIYGKGYLMVVFDRDAACALGRLADTAASNISSRLGKKVTAHLVSYDIAEDKSQEKENS